MVKFKSKKCKKCDCVTTHQYVGKEMYWILPLWFYKYWKCCDCGSIHKQDTAFIDDEWN